jgi:hypothetical protein
MTTGPENYKELLLFLATAGVIVPLLGSRQAQLIGDQTKELGQRMMQGIQGVARATEEGTAESRRRSEAA